MANEFGMTGLARRLTTKPALHVCCSHGTAPWRIWAWMGRTRPCKIPSTLQFDLASFPLAGHGRPCDVHIVFVSVRPSHSWHDCTCLFWVWKYCMLNVRLAGNLDMVNRGFMLVHGDFLLMSRVTSSWDQILRDSCASRLLKPFSYCALQTCTWEYSPNCICHCVDVFSVCCVDLHKVFCRWFLFHWSGIATIVVYVSLVHAEQHPTRRSALTVRETRGTLSHLSSLAYFCVWERYLFAQ